MRTKAEIQAEINRVQTMRLNFERDYRWRNNNLYFVKGLEWVIGDKVQSSEKKPS